MKFVTFLHRKQQRVGIVLDNGILDLSHMWNTQPRLKRVAKRGVFLDLVRLIGAGPDIGHQVEVAARKQRNGLDGLLAIDEVKLLAPIPRPPKNVFCVGLNYLEHVKEGAVIVGRSADAPEFPNFFTKPPTAVIGPEAEIVLDRNVTNSLDYEAELGIIIGRAGINISEADALKYVFGYTIINDISARDLQKRQGQWFKGKSLDTTCPMGPFIVSAQDLPDPQNLNIQLRLNGQEMQSANTRLMIFGVAKIISYLSQGMLLEPGDIIATGTPSGSGYARQPPVFLADGDLVEAQVEGIGTLRNRVVERGKMK